MADARKKLSFAKAAASAMKKDQSSSSVTMLRSPRIVNGTEDPSSLTNGDTTSLTTAVPLSAKSPPAKVVVSNDLSKDATGAAAENSLQPLAPPSIAVATELDSLEITPDTSKAVQPETAAVASAEMQALAMAGNACNSGTGRTPPSSEEVSQKADSNSELGTKPPSLDGKSITSGTTFNALDEKESLRPDDSASVKAAAEEDDAFSVRSSFLINARLGSDLATSAQRIHLGGMPPKVLVNVNQEPSISDVETPNSGSSAKQPVTEASVHLATNASSPTGVNGQNPDEKLLEAMQTPKDRLFLLRLENDVVSFVQNSKEPFMDLPPSNSFCRMLSHKLADYYHMTHSFEAAAGSVRIFRTPFCRVPLPLSSFVSSTPSTSTPPPAILPRRIMRRGEDSDLPISAGPSKPTSEVGSDPKEKTAAAKDKLSREAREEAYNKAREQIFADSIPETSTPENGDSTGISRSSSVSTKDRTHGNKKGKPNKQRRDDSETFETRSHYMPMLAHPQQHPQQATWVAPQSLASSGPPYGGPGPFHPHAGPLPQHPSPFTCPATQPLAFSTSMPPYVAAPPGNDQSLNSAPLHQLRPGQPVPPRGPLQTATPAYNYVPSGQPPSQWQQHPPTALYGHPPVYPVTGQARPGPPLHVGVPYAFGQLPTNGNPHDPQSQHPIPGSYSGHSLRAPFNPKTQSFVPANVAMPTPMHMPMAEPSAGLAPYGSGGPGPMAITGSFNTGSPYVAHQGFPTSPCASNRGSGYGVMCQGSENMAAGYVTQQPHLPQPPVAGGYQQASMTPYGSGMATKAPTAVHGNMGQPLPNHLGLMHGVSRGPSLHGKTPYNSSNQGQKIFGANKASGASPSGSKGHTVTPGKPYGNLPNYGNPATLPQKPATTN